MIYLHSWLEFSIEQINQSINQSIKIVYYRFCLEVPQPQKHINFLFFPTCFCLNKTKQTKKTTTSLQTHTCTLTDIISSNSSSTAPRNDSPKVSPCQPGRAPASAAAPRAPWAAKPRRSRAPRRRRRRPSRRKRNGRNGAVAMMPPSRHSHMPYGHRWGWAWGLGKLSLCKFLGVLLKKTVCGG